MKLLLAKDVSSKKHWEKSILAHIIKVNQEAEMLELALIENFKEKT